MNNKIFTSDWFSNNIERFNKHLGHLKGKPDLNFLEIGSYEGRSTVWLLENILTDKSSKITCIDTFKGSYEHLGMDLNNLYDIFNNNIREYHNQVESHIAFSKEALLFNSIRSKRYDFIYIDGCHESKEVLEDAVLCWELLKDGGIMIFDDYEWRGSNDINMNPKIAVESFINCYRKYINILAIEYQVVIEKKVL